MRLFVIFLFLAYTPIQSIAQTGGVFTENPPSNHGCVIGGRLYYVFLNNFTEGNNFRRNFDPNYYSDLTCSNNNYYIAGLYVNQNNLANGTTTSNGCGITGTDYASSGAGKMYEFNIINCTIDNNKYAFFSILLLGLIFNFRKSNLKLSSIFKI